jgi:hypothetical protein
VLLFQKNYGQRTIYGSTFQKAIGVMLVAMFKLKEPMINLFIHHSMKKRQQKKFLTIL